MRELKEILYREFYDLVDDIVDSGELDSDSLDELAKMAAVLDSCDKMEKEHGHSREGRGYSRDGGDWEARGSYEQGSSYRRRRDRMGRYSSDSGNSREGGYSRDDGKEKMKEHLQKAMQSAENDDQKESIKRILDQMNRE